MRLVLAAALAALLSSAAAADTNTVSYNVAPGACSKPITIPVNNKPVMLMGNQILSPTQGGGHVSLFRGADSNHLLFWQGIDFAQGVEVGWSKTDVHHIFWLDYTGQVDVQVAATGHIQVCNASQEDKAAGYLTFMY